MAEQQENGSIPAGRRLPGRRLLRVLWVLAALSLSLSLASFFLEEPLRRAMEANINRDLKGYTVRLPGLKVRLIGLSLTLQGLTVRQQAHPEPPVAYFPSLQAKIHWSGVLSGRLVAEFLLDRPQFHVDLQQLHEEAANTVSLKKRGWQQAVEDIYPLKINSLKVSDASFTYIDQDPKNPLILSRLNLQAHNIRNLQLPDKVYPSSFHLDTVIFGSGQGSVDGRANFLAEPTPGIKAGITLDRVPVGYFRPVFARSNLAIDGGVLRAVGELEYAPKVRVAHLQELTIRGMKIDYLHSGKTARSEKRRARAAGKTAEQLSNRPGLLLGVDRLRLAGCNLGMVNDSGGKRFRVFLSDTDFTLTNFSNQFARGPAKLSLAGRFMGTGSTHATGLFRPEQKGADLDLYVKIDNTQLTSMNELLRAYGNFDVAAGTFSLVTELHVKDDRISGYIKPFFKDLKVYDQRKDKDKGIFHQMYELLIGGVAKLLENRSREQVATKADISGALNKPHTSSWQVVLGLIRNAFFKAILPTFEREAAKGGKR